MFLSVFFTQKYLHVTKASAAADKKKNLIFIFGLRGSGFAPTLKIHSDLFT